MRQQFDPYARHYASLSVEDLLDGREACHLQLSHTTDVIATAIGLYRIRTTDPDGKHFQPAKKAAGARGKLGARRLENTVVQPWSWPCVLVFVRQWLDKQDLRAHPESAVPPFIYLSDGRVVPVCTLEASLYAGSPPPVTGPLTFASHVIGGGYPVVTEVQGRDHVGTIACLVTDGERYYALTNQHVAGAAGQEIYSLIKGERVRIWVAAGGLMSRRKAPFTDLYPGFAGADTQSNLDIGLIDIDDSGLWTAQVFGLGVLGRIIDFDRITATLDWIGVPVIAHGARGGRMLGETKGLFYRYATLNGTDYLSDFLIGGRGNAALPTAPGDSGTLWCLDPEAVALKDDAAPSAAPRAAGKASKPALPAVPATAKAVDLPLRFRPIAVQWGGQKLSQDGGEAYTQFALATSAAVGCSLLDVEIVTDLNAEHTAYWGPVGHYKIAELAIQKVKSTALKKFLAANIAQLTYDAATIATGKLVNDAAHFVPLADVPDVVWKTNINRGGKAARAQENWNHYADMDLPGADGRTLFDLCGSPPRVSLSDWLAFYKTAPVPAKGKGTTNNMGALPFRVWQIFAAMAGFKAKADADKFLCAAGILSHYAGDSCQPLHSSQHSDGIDGATTGVHSTYEDKMVDKFAADIGTALDQFDWKSLGADLPAIATGYQAAQAVIELMRRSQKRLPPVLICQTYNDLGGGTGQATIKGLWEKLGKATVACIADGTRTLAAIWEAAYAAAGAPSFAGAIAQPALKKIYEAKTFLPSLHMANFDPKDYPLPAAKAAAGSPPAKAKRRAAARSPRRRSKT